MASTTGGHVQGFGTTNRTDNWWVGPALTVAGLGAWLLYYFWAALQGQYYHAGPYLSPFYAPLLFSDVTAAGSAPVEHAFFGAWPAAIPWPSFIPKSPALLIGFLPGMFRITCYYYRKAYYRSFFGMPPGCAVGAQQVTVGGDYRGETMLLVWQNLHRYTMYIAVALLPFLFYEAFTTLTWNGQFGFGLGSFVIWMNAILLACYTFGCHAWRHLIGGRLNCFSCDGGAEAQYSAWSLSTWFNERHMMFAWMSLYWILFADIYVRLLSLGVIPDVNTWSGVTWMGTH